MEEIKAQVIKSAHGELPKYQMDNLYHDGLSNAKRIVDFAVFKGEDT